MQKGLKVFVGIATGTASVFMLFALLIVGSGLNDDIHRADVGVVLGNKVETNGQQVKIGIAQQLR
ncbi:MAG: hypothetical protein WA902_14630 [Thermosynechococcaceae cyanobacterium]